MSTTTEEAAALTFAHRERAQSLNAVKAALQNAITRGDLQFIAPAIGLRINDLKSVVDQVERLGVQSEEAGQLRKMFAEWIGVGVELGSLPTVVMSTLDNLRTQRDELLAGVELATMRTKADAAEIERLRNGECVFEGPHQAGCDGEPKCFVCAMRRVKALTEELDTLRDAVDYFGNEPGALVAARTQVKALEERDALDAKYAAALVVGLKGDAAILGQFIYQKDALEAQVVAIKADRAARDMKVAEAVREALIAEVQDDGERRFGAWPPRVVTALRGLPVAALLKGIE